MRRFGSPLDNIKIASPCSMNWDEMFGDNRKRFCGECKLNVYNLSDMSESEAENLLVETEGRLCVKYYRRADGTVLTKDCPVGWEMVKRHLSVCTTAVFSLVLGILSGMFSVSMFPKQTEADLLKITSPLYYEPQVEPTSHENELENWTVGMRVITTEMSKRKSKSKSYKD